MRRVLVPLDGSKLAEAIVPDARRLAGPDGELILVRDARFPFYLRSVLVDTTMLAVEEAEWYLHHEAEKLRDESIAVRTQSLILADAASAIDEAARIFKADLIAIATHGRSPLGRLLHGGTAWRALAHSPVPVLLRRVENETVVGAEQQTQRRIMVPLDGSAYAEKALPLAQELAREWDAPLWLIQVAFAPDYTVPSTPDPPEIMPLNAEKSMEEAHAYLARIAASLQGNVHIEVGLGTIVDHLTAYVDRLRITDVVMASHGLTGLPRVILGSVADALVHRLHCPVIVVPALAVDRAEKALERNEAAVATHAGEEDAKE